ncbi:NADP-dependent oxidoreductase [Flavitalea flava]
MKAFVLKQPGGIENLVKEELPTPVIKDNEVLIKVAAISINPADAYVRGDAARILSILGVKEGEQPVILGWDVAGTVTEVGKLVSAFQIGDEVFGMVNFVGHGKAYAEYVAAPAAHLAKKPLVISQEEAAASTLAALTAWQSLVTYAKIKKGDKVLIHSAAGGVGHYAVQLAKHFGAYVIGTASAKNRDFVLSLGADEFIDYKTQPFESIVQDADIILDAVSDPKHLARSLKAVRPGGLLISLLFHFDEAFVKQLRQKGVVGHRHMVGSSGDDMRSLAVLLEQGALKSHVSHVYSFDELPQAHLQIETGTTRGKIIVRV